MSELKQEDGLPVLTGNENTVLKIIQGLQPTLSEATAMRIRANPQEKDRLEKLDKQIQEELGPAPLERINFRKIVAHLEPADTLVGLDFSTVPQIQECIFDGLNLGSCRWGGRLIGCSFRNARLTKSYVFNTEFQECDFTGADLSQLVGEIKKSGGLRRDEVSKYEYGTLRFFGCGLVDAVLNVTSQGYVVSSTSLVNDSQEFLDFIMKAGAYIPPGIAAVKEEKQVVRLGRKKLTEEQVRVKINLRDFDYSGYDMSSISSISLAEIMAANISGVPTNFSGALLPNDVTGVSFANTLLLFADLSQCSDLTQGQLEGAVCNERTLLPEGVKYQVPERKVKPKEKAPPPKPTITFRQLLYDRWLKKGGHLDTAKADLKVAGMSLAVTLAVGTVVVGFCLLANAANTGWDNVNYSGQVAHKAGAALIGNVGGIPAVAWAGVLIGVMLLAATVAAIISDIKACQNPEEPSIEGYGPGSL